MRPSSKRPRVEPSGTAPPPPSATGTTSGEAFADPADDAAAAVPPPFASDDFDISTYVEDCHDRLGGSWSAFGRRA